MKKSLIALLLVAGCGASEQPAGNGSAPDGNAADANKVVGQAVSTARLTGLYEGGGAPQTNQLCIIDRGSGNAQFGLVVWGGNMHSCSGAGAAVREGESLRLTMAGDESCVIDAKMEGGTVTLPSDMPAGCSYYCGARARMEGATFARKGDTAEDAMKAKDLVGEPLCAGLSDGG